VPVGATTYTGTELCAVVGGFAVGPPLPAVVDALLPGAAVWDAPCEADLPGPVGVRKPVEPVAVTVAVVVAQSSPVPVGSVLGEPVPLAEAEPPASELWLASPAAASPPAAEAVAVVPAVAESDAVAVGVVVAVAVQDTPAPEPVAAEAGRERTVPYAREPRPMENATAAAARRVRLNTDTPTGVSWISSFVTGPPGAAAVGEADLARDQPSNVAGFVEGGDP
jgi:hypothetical protein